ncbi:hypothetical protein [Scytonema sp. NUACC26]|uniref:hypothetical protein n=1 Tax=Scytonema sp. NUACC26 TaxID=3140176 RepID=UPI0034DC0D58
MTETVTLQIPISLYQRLVNTASATKRPLEDIILHALRVGSPPDWDNVPDEFQVDLAALDKMEDEALWKIAHSQKSLAEMERYNDLLERNQDSILSDAERAELTALRMEADCFMLRKAQAAAILRWRGHYVPLS